MSEREQDTGGQKAHMGITAGDKAAQREGHRQPSKKEEKKQEAVVEAVLFAMGESVELRQLAAAIDGAGILRTFFQIILPQLKPVTVTRLIMIAVGTWNNYAMPTYLLTNTNKAR